MEFRFEPMASVSVIIPAFNAAATLSATVASVVRQTHTDWEAIIFDDGSTDSTAANAQAWCDRDPRIKLIKGPNRGLAGARNQGAHYATSPWLLFLDADDLLKPIYLETMLAAAAVHPSPDLVHCAGSKVALDGRIGRPEIPPHKDYFKLLASHNLFYVHACLVRRSTFEKFGGFDTALDNCEEWDLWQRLARAGTVFVGIDDSLALYQLRSRSMSRDAELLFKNGRQIILRGHGRDPRVSNPLPALAEGQRSQDSAQAIIAFASWCAGILIGSGKNPEPFLRKIEFPPTSSIVIDDCLAMMQGGIPRGACLLNEDWPTLWPIHKTSIHDAFLVVEERCASPNFAQRCIKLLEDRLRWLNETPKAVEAPSGTDAQSGSMVGNVGNIRLPILLMYHRINRKLCDPWMLNVTPENFSEQLTRLKQERDVVPLSWLVSELRRGQLPSGTAALTFDDGYADALNNAKPLLQKHRCPATFFLTTGLVGHRQGYWWDVLARIILETTPLPGELTLDIQGREHSWRLATNETGRPADASVVSTTELYFAVWGLLKSLGPDERQSVVSSIAVWAGTHADSQECDRTLEPDEVRRLYAPGFIDIGAHSVTHPSLPSLGSAEQLWEIEESRIACEELTGSLVPGFAYPFGDFDDTSRAAVSAAGFQFACTTAESPLLPGQDLMRLPRINVGDWDAAEFDAKILRR